MDMDATRRLWDTEALTFDEASDHGLRDPLVRETWRLLLAGHLPPSPARVADLGCGTGTLAVLLAEQGYVVDGVDLSPEMVSRARAKAEDLPVTFAEGDASAPDLPTGGYDVVLCRHVLWALPDPVDALGRWVALLRPAGRLLLVEGAWSTGAGLTAEECTGLLAAAGRSADVVPLPDPALWGAPTEDERYLVVSSG